MLLKVKSVMPYDIELAILTLSSLKEYSPKQNFSCQGTKSCEWELKLSQESREFGYRNNAVFGQKLLALLEECKVKLPFFNV